MSLCCAPEARWRTAARVQRSFRTLPVSATPYLRSVCVRLAASTSSRGPTDAVYSTPMNRPCCSVSPAWLFRMDCHPLTALLNASAQKTSRTFSSMWSAARTRAPVMAPRVTSPQHGCAFHTALASVNNIRFHFSPFSERTHEASVGRRRAAAGTTVELGFRCVAALVHCK
jgi:hypothetical protein